MDRIDYIDLSEYTERGRPKTAERLELERKVDATRFAYNAFLGPTLSDVLFRFYLRLRGKEYRGF
jgi:hypothetical protein